MSCSAQHGTCERPGGGVYCVHACVECGRDAGVVLRAVAVTGWWQHAAGSEFAVDGRAPVRMLMGCVTRAEAVNDRRPQQRSRHGGVGVHCSRCALQQVCVATHEVDVATQTRAKQRTAPSGLLQLRDMVACKICMHAMHAFVYTSRGGHTAMVTKYEGNSMREMRKKLTKRLPSRDSRARLTP